MRTVPLPDIPYGATAVRPDWADLPNAVRDTISARLGGPVVSATSAGGGFTRAFAATLSTASGDHAFVKAAPLTDPEARFYAREAAVTAALPIGVRAARPRWTEVVRPSGSSPASDGYFVLCLDAVDGRVPGLPWSAADLTAALDAWSAASAALAAPPVALYEAGLPLLPDLIRDELSWWTEIAAGREPMPAVPSWVPRRLGALVKLETALPALAAGGGMSHGDLRVDNVLIDGSGAAWLCDWTWPCLGAPWFDTVTLLVSAYAGGADVDALLAPWSPPAGGVDGVLAAMGGYWLMQASAGPSSASPHSRQHHRFSGRQALSWLADRQGWPVHD